MFDDEEEANMIKSEDTVQGENRDPPASDDPAALQAELATAKEQILKYKREAENARRANIETLLSTENQNQPQNKYTPLQLQSYASKFVPTFDARDPTKLRDFVEAVDYGKRDWDLNDKEAATLAVYSMPEGSDAKRWLLQRKKRLDYENIDYWEARNGLKKALIDFYGSSSDIAVLEHQLASTMKQKSGQTTTDFLTQLDTSVNDFLKFILGDNIHEEEECFVSIHERTLLYFMRSGLHPDMKRVLEHKLEALLTPKALAKAALDKEVEIGICGSAKAGKAQPQKVGEPGSSSNPYQLAQAQAQTQNQTSDTVHSAAAATTTKPKKLCDYCGLRNHVLEGCKFRKADMDAKIFRDKSDPYPMLTQSQKRKLKKKAKLEQKVAEMAAAMVQASQGVPPPTNAQNAAPSGGPLALTYGSTAAAATASGQGPIGHGIPPFMGSRPGWVPNSGQNQAYFTSAMAQAQAQAQALAQAQSQEAKVDPYYLESFQGPQL